MCAYDSPRRYATLLWPCPPGAPPVVGCWVPRWLHMWMFVLWMPKFLFSASWDMPGTCGQCRHNHNMWRAGLRMTVTSCALRLSNGMWYVGSAPLLLDESRWPQCTWMLATTFLPLLPGLCQIGWELPSVIHRAHQEVSLLSVFFVAHTSLCITQIEIPQCCACIPLCRKYPEVRHTRLIRQFCIYLPFRAVDLDHVHCLFRDP